MSAHPTTGRPVARPAAIARWLFLVAALILLMVLVGGVTRLTESGLSITEWKPVTGALPPIGDAAWAAEFERYKHSSQYELMNQGMTLAAFQHIFFWEYVHRLLGRIIGLVYALPMLWFFARRAVPRGHGVRLVILLLLGGAQGAVGWLMVKSGLTDRVNVEPAMLAAHLGMALILMGAVLWTACDMRLLTRNPVARPVRPTLWGVATVILLFVQLLLGAITAGLRAGYVSSTWPLMNDHIVPEGIVWWGSFWRTITSDQYLVHFIHRWWAWGVALAIFVLARQLQRVEARGMAHALLTLVAVQILLGIATVVTGVALPIAVTHQVAGAVLLGVTVAGAHRLGAERVRG
ncbi:COX15/CtaA family protein [Sphingobium sufflavum]|nr:COX15/CtaA family protein [Sphingobium sufflavum]MCE7795088.1 COX15/CtaA family protein [Sphingobium sufflavum]